MAAEAPTFTPTEEPPVQAGFTPTDTPPAASKPPVPANSSQNLPSYAQRTAPTDWHALFSGKYTPEQEAAFAKSDSFSANPEQARQRIISQMFVKSSMPQVSEDYIQSNWESVKRSFAQEVLGVTPSKTYSDSALYGGIANLLAVKDEVSPFKAVAETPILSLPYSGHEQDSTTIPVMIGGMPFPASTPAFAAKVWNAGPRQLVEGSSTPKNLALMATGVGAEKMGATALAFGIKGYFGASMAATAVQRAPQVKAIMEDPNKSLTEKVTAFNEELMNVVGAGLLGVGMTFDMIDPGEAKAITAETKGKTGGEAAKIVAAHAENVEDPKQKALLMSAADELHKFDPSDARTPPAPDEPSIPKEAVKIAEEPPPPEKGKILTGIKNDLVDEERERMGLEKAEHGESTDWETQRAKAATTLEDDPLAGKRVVDDLAEKMRPVSLAETFLILHEKTRATVEHERAADAVIEAEKTGDRDAIGTARGRLAQARDEYNKVSQVVTEMGTGTAQTLAARAVTMKEDYSIAAVERQLAAENKGGKLTPEDEKTARDISKRYRQTKEDLDKHLAQRLKARKAAIAKSTEEMKARLASGELAPKPKAEPVELDEEGQRLLAEHNKVKGDLQDAILKKQSENRSTWERLQDWVVKWRRALLISRLSTLTRVGVGGIERMGITPAEEAVGAGLEGIPIIHRVALKAPREGGLNVDAEAHAVTQAITKLMSDASSVLRTGRGEIDFAYGKRGQMSAADSMGSAGIDFFGRLHGALWAPVKRAEFTRSLEKRLVAARRGEEDISNPLVQTKHAVLAYKDANASVFMQDNILTDAFKRFVSTFEQIDKKTGKPRSKIGATAARVAVPIVKIPTNVVAETMQYATGTLTGSYHLARAVHDGIDTLSPEQADLIMRELKKGSLGAAAMALGYFKADHVGGLYQPGKRDPKDVPFGSIRLFGHDIPAYLLAAPLLNAIQIGATVRRVAEAKVKNEENGFGTGAAAAALGLIREVPMMRTPTLENPTSLRKMGSDLVVPGFLQEAAQHFDKDAEGKPIQRKVDSFGDQLKSGIPGLRETLPQRNPTKSRRKKSFVPTEAAP